jgi:hypothetical protein
MRVPHDDQIAQTGAFLRLLLVRPSDYREVWAAEVISAAGAQGGPGTVDYAAIGRVLARAAQNPREPETRAVLDDPRLREALTDPEGLARAALEAEELTPATLELFIEGFSLTSRHAHRLRELMRGSPAVRVVSGEAAITVGLYRGGPPRHETLSVHEMHTLGPDGRPAEHDTIQVIKSNVDRLESYPFYFDTDELAVEVVRGGRVGDRIYRVDQGFFGLDIVLAEPLSLGETALIQFHTTFAYKSDPPPELRRGVLRTIQDLTMWVKFHPERVPAAVWLAKWDGVNHAKVIEQEPAELDNELSVHARLGAVERSIIGFYWEWPSPLDADEPTARHRL